ncbi:MAG: hypothetical protein IAE82_06855 [Opitutaceae bacterium]|nr:hypothetical protein [Opitutaceae bacterium]
MRHYHHEVPGPFGIILQILSGAVVGLLIAGAYLALKPVKVMDAQAAAKAAKDTGAVVERNVVAYVPGNPGHPSGQQWRVRETAFLNRTAPGVAISETDLNRWIATTYGAADRKFEIKEVDLVIEPHPPLCRLDGAEMQVGFEFACAMGESKKSVVAQARGHFEKQGDRHVFVPTTVYLGSCPLPGKLGTMLVEKLGAAYPIPDATAASWKAVTSAKIEESQLKLAFN